jgi:hypothetical protein
MPRAYADQLAAMRAYAQTPAGKAAKARSHANYIAKRRAQNQARKINPQPLAEAVQQWSKT